MKLVRSLLLTAPHLWGLAKAAGVSSQLQVHLPHSLTRPGGYDHREALFGVPPYGGSIQQAVYYADSDLCDPSSVDTSGGFPARPTDKNGKMAPWPSPYILMVDRGGCTFVIKVRNAQRSGAAAVIIADNTCLCTAGDACTPENENEECETQEPYMADDGSGSDISIPSFLMFKQDADPIKNAMIQGQVVRMEMAWALPTPDSRVEYELWTTPTDKVSREFQRQFRTAAKALGTHAYFTPHMYIYDGVLSGCRSESGENECFNLCTNNGRYCATDPDNDLDRGISGADVVKESLRRLCIWKQYGEADGVGEEWWKYVDEFLSRCDKPDYFNNDDCVKDAMTHAGIESHKIENCMSDSGGLDDDVVNTMLASEIAQKKSSGVVIMPAAFVNKVAIRGALEFATVFRGVCAGFESGSQPQVCKTCMNCHDQYSCVQKGHCVGGGAQDGGLSVTVFLGALLGVVLVFSIVGFILYRRSQSRMHDEVRGILAQYMPLDKTNGQVQSAVSDEDDEEFTIS